MIAFLHIFLIIINHRKQTVSFGLNRVWRLDRLRFESEIDYEHRFRRSREEDWARAAVDEALLRAQAFPAAEGSPSVPRGLLLSSADGEPSRLRHFVVNIIFQRCSDLLWIWVTFFPGCERDVTFNNLCPINSYENICFPWSIRDELRYISRWMLYGKSLYYRIFMLIC